MEVKLINRKLFGRKRRDVKISAKKRVEGGENRN